MKRSKFIFIAFSLVFLITLVFFVIDLGRRTTFPGSNKKKMENSASSDSSGLNGKHPNDDH